MLSYDPPVVVNGQDSGASISVSSPTTILKQNQLNSSSSKSQTASMGSTGSTAFSAEAPSHHHIVLVTGPAGCGKTTVGEHIAEATGMPYIEGDSVSFCTKQNMSFTDPIVSLSSTTPKPTSRR